MVPARIHVGRAPQVLDPCGVQDQKAVSYGHLREGVAFPRVAAPWQRDVFLDLHAYSLQQIHGQHDYKALPVQIWPFSRIISNFIYTFKL